MNLRERIETALTGGLADRVPFTTYRNKIPQGEAERRLREKGLGYSWRQDIVRWDYPNCDIRTVHFNRDGARFARTVWSTPRGEVSDLFRLGGEYDTAWQMEWPLKRREDYAVMEFVADDARPSALYDEFRAAQRNVGGDGYVVCQTGYSPLMTMIVNLTGFESYAYHMADWPGEFWSLYEALNRKARRAYPIVAAGPQLVTLFGGNVHPGVLGRRLFAEKVVSCYDELGAMLHEEGKLLAVHLDADNAHWADIVAASAIDVVEALTPPPDCDLSVADARRLWPEKVLWLNFPSSVHLAAGEVIRRATLDILAQAGDGSRLIIGITENIPDDCWEKSLNVIADTLNEHGALPLGL